ncbi:carboxypeptidase-like regulatory domain-containing protein [Aeoliella mucimassa]|uniref:Carboxypeptidase regulatory-like domain-containing protein n=1 Tax=Aeoliella mucimassa TaxID=2527972 RepID=A0A518AS45_9BACT|nr:carboxypeptidase-like regulatory domain-containing protein [Aeoliella mucimassa]QDU57549.1 hypothetical protein Pan181_37670 [Aeoliella mucimassa]
MSSRLSLFCYLLSLTLLAGCGADSASTKVSGTISVSGQAMGTGAVTFFPTDEGQPIGVPVDASGSYTASVPPGSYSVVVVTSTPPPEGWKEGDPLPPPPVKVPSKYTQPRFTPLKLTVGQENLSKDFNLE